MSEELLRRLADRVEIAELSATYNRAIDDLDGKTVAALFTEDGVFDLGRGRPREGREDIERLVERIPYGTVHATTDAVISIEGDRAAQVSTLLLCKRRRDRAEAGYWLSGRYHDELRRTDEGWRFCNRRAELDLVE
ncbi:MAG TPA: nuclear transport factor 2 family protein [Solirubrobacterales bacterium]|jgi:uncharacterized protein (TIGR02246 family)